MPDDIKLYPYPSWTTFRGVIEKLASFERLPSHIDKSVLSNYSGATQSQLLATFKFLNLIDDNLKPTEILERLVATFDTEHWPERLAAMISAAYPETTLSTLAIGTPKSCMDSFPDSSVEVRVKSYRFVVYGAQEAKLKISPHIMDAKGKIKGATVTRKKNRSGRKASADEAEKDAGQAPNVRKPDADMKSWPMQLGTGRTAELRWPKQITRGELKTLLTLIDALKVLLEAEATTAETFSSEGAGQHQEAT